MFATFIEFTLSSKLKSHLVGKQAFYFFTVVASIGDSQLCSSHDIVVKHFTSSKAHTQYFLASGISMRYSQVGKGEYSKTPKHNSLGRIFYFMLLFLMD